MPDKAILIPAALLVCWTMVMAVWMLIDRAKVFKQAKINLADAPDGARSVDLKDRLPPNSDWPGHNYMHLMEQPTVYYAAIVFLSIGGPSGYDYGLAWAYLFLRVVHSIWQARFNKVMIRAAIFALSSMVMLLLSVRALLSVLA